MFRDKNLVRKVAFFIGIFALIVLVFSIFLAFTDKNSNSSRQKYEYFTQNYMYNDIDLIKQDIDSCSKEGYKVLSLNGAGENSVWYLVMEKIK